MQNGTLRNIFVLPIFQSAFSVSTAMQMLSQHFSLLSCQSKTIITQVLQEKIRQCVLVSILVFKTSNSPFWDHRGMFSEGL